MAEQKKKKKRDNLVNFRTHEDLEDSLDKEFGEEKKAEKRPYGSIQ